MLLHSLKSWFRGYSFRNALSIFILTFLLLTPLEARPHSRSSRKEKEQATKFCQQGEAFLKKKQYDSAVRRFMMAVKLNPGRTKYADLRDSAIKQGQSNHFSMATLALNNKDLGVAKDHLEKAQSFTTHLSSKTKLSILNTKIASLEAKALIADRTIKAKQYEKALKEYRELISEWPTNKTFQQQEAAIYKHVEAKEVARADYLLRTNFRWHEAKAAAKKLIKHYPQNSRLKEILSESTNKLSAHEYAKQGKTYLAKGNYDKALSLFSKTFSMFPGYPKIRELKKSAAAKANESYKTMVNKSIATNDWPQAISSLRKILATDSTDKNSRTQITTVKKKYAKEIVADSVRLSKKGLSGTSISASIKALGYDPANRTAREALSAAKNRIINNTKRRVFINSFENGSSINNLPTIYENHIRTTLESYKIPFIKLVYKVSHSDIEIKGTIKEATIYEKRAAVTRSVQYQSGTQNFQNPNYNTAVQRYNQAQANMNQAQRQSRNVQQGDKVAATASLFSLTLTSNAFAAAKRNLSRTPQTISRPTTANHQYPVTTVSKKGVVILDVVIYDRKTRKTIVSETIKKEEVHNDVEIIADAAKGIKGDPLNLPSDRDIYSSIVGQSMGEMSKVLERFKFAEYFKILPAQKELTRGSNENRAIERSLGAFYATRGANEKMFPDYAMKYLSGRVDLSASELTTLLKK